jgi:hypothetical protein
MGKIGNSLSKFTVLLYNQRKGKAMEASKIIQLYKEGSEHDKSLLGLSALAFEPLSTDDLQKIIPKEFPTFETIIQTLKSLSLVLELSENYLVITNKKYKETIFKYLIENGLEENWEKEFIRFGDRTLEQLQNSTIKSSETNRYIVRHYHNHLYRANAPQEKILSLLDPFWCEACEWWGERKEYIRITERVFEFAQEEPANLGILVRSVLLKTSQAYVHPIPGKFLAAALEKKVISPEYAFAMIPDPEKEKFIFEDNLRELRVVLPEPFASKIQELIETHDILVDEDEDDEWVQPEPKVEILSLSETKEEFEKIKQLEDISDQHSDMCNLFPCAHPAIIPEMIDFWIDNLTGWQYFPTDFIQRLPDELVDKVFEIGVFFLTNSHPRVADDGVHVLFEILERLNAKQLQTLLNEYRFTSLYHFELIDLLNNLAENEIQVIVGEIESSARVPAISQGIIQEIKSFTPTGSRSYFPDIFPKDPLKYADENGIDEELDVESELEQIGKLDSEWKKLNSLIELAFKLPSTLREPVLNQAIEIVVKSERDQEKFEFITKVAGILSEEQLNWALELAKQIDHPMTKMGYQGWSQSVLLATLSYRFSRDMRQEIEQSAIEAADRHTFYFVRAHILGSLIRILPIYHYPKILDLATTVENEWGDYAAAVQMSEVIARHCVKWDQIYRTRDEEYQALVKVLRIANQNPRWVLMRSLKDVLPIISQLGGEQAMAEAFISVIQVNEWWP